jgi:hypothetical protein
MLFSPGSASEPYEAIRDTPHLADVKAFLENLWVRFFPYTNKKHFLNEIRKEDGFYQRLWELHLGCILLDQGYQLTNVGNKGPDFLITFDDKKIWIEATAPMAGTEEDAVPPLQWNSSVAQEVPEEKIILRFINTIDKKWKKYKEYLEHGIIKCDDIYIIAVGWNNLNYFHTLNDNDDIIPYIIRSVLPFGTLMAGFSRETNEVVKYGYGYRDKIQKKNDREISTKMFLEEKYAGISAIIYSEENLINIPKSLGGSFFLYLHNPLAKIELPRGTFKFCKEYWYLIEERKLEFKDWRKK